MKGNTKKTDMTGFGAYWVRQVVTTQKPLQLPSSRKDGGKWFNSKEEKHQRHLRRKLNQTGGTPRGRVASKMSRLGWKSESLKDLTRVTQ